MAAITGTSANDILAGTSADDLIDGGAGDDRIEGQGGLDVLIGGQGADDILGGAERDVIYAGERPTGQVAWDWNTDHDADRIDAGGGDDLIYASLGDTVIGGAGNDHLVLNLARSSVGQVLDFGAAVTGTVYLNGGGSFTGVESVTYFGGLGGDHLTGGAGDDVLVGEGGNDTLLGGGGDDYLSGHVGVDAFDGGDGVDRVSLFSLWSTQGAVADLSTGVISNDGNGNAETMVNVEGLGGGTRFTDRFRGDGGDNFFVVTSSDSDADVVEGGGGNDSFQLSSAAALVDGGEGNDTITRFTQSRLVETNGDGIAEWAYTTAGVVVDLGMQRIHNDGFGRSGELRSIENVGGSDGNDQLVGSEGANILTGYAGSDNLHGRGGDDTIHGGAGDDRAQGEAGNDTLDGGAGSDVATFVLPASMTGRLQMVDGPDGTLLVQRVDGATTETLFRVTLTGTGAVVEGLNSAAGLGTDTVSNTEQLHFILDNAGGAFDPDRFVSLWLTPTQYGEWVNGSEAADTIRVADYPGAINVDGGRGDDVIVGDGAGNYLIGGAGSDRIDGGGAHDIASFQLAPGTTGALRLVEGSGADAGRLLVQRVDGDTVETVFVVTIDSANATATVTGVNSAARLGTDTVTNVEDLHFFVQNSPPGGAFVHIPLAPSVPELSGDFAHVSGSYADDVIDLAALYPGAPVTANLNAHGGYGADVISGHAGGNWMDGGAGDDVLRGLDGGDTLHGGAGRDTLEGGAGDDRVHGEGGDDRLDGGEGGNDVAAFVLPTGTPGTLRLVDGTGENAGKLVVERVDGSTVETLFVVTLNGTTATVTGVNSAAHHGTDVVTGVEEMHFFVQNDVFNPAQFANIRLAPDQFGNFVSGSEIGDVINLADYPGAVNANGGRGDDTLTGNAAANVLRGGAGDDVVDGAGGADAVFGDVGADVLRGGAGDDFLRGGVGADSYDGGEGFDRVSFFEVGATSGVVVDLRTGIVSNDGFGNVETLTSIEGLGGGTRFADTFQGNDEANQFFGGSGDTIEGFGGADRFLLGGAPALVDGGAGVDEVEVFFQSRLTDLNGDGVGEDQTTTAGVHVDLGRQLIVNDGFGGSGTIRNVENLGGSDGADLLVGDSAANVLTGHLGDDRLEGGAGVDTARYFGPRSQYVVAVTAEGFTVSGPEGVDTLVGIEQIQFADQTMQLRRGGAGGDLLIGGAGGDVLAGLGGDDFLRGMEGADQLLGGDGADFLVGGAGDDLIDGGAGMDRAAFSSGAVAGVRVDLRLQGTAQDTGQGMDTLVGIENVSGTRFNDVITGDEGSNWLWGGSDGSGVTGDDVISAGGGDDLVEVGTGNHLLEGGAGVDALSLYGNQFDITSAGVTLSLALQGSAQATGQGAMTVSGFENLSGSIHGDRLTGDGAGNVIGGGGGADEIDGGGGNDLLLGDGMFVQSGGAAGTTGSVRLVDDANVTFGHAAGADTLRGGEGDDTLFGGRGDDALDGGAGADTARYAGLRADYVVTDLGGGRYTVSGPEGTDTLTAVEALQFSDQTVQLRPPGEVYVGTEDADVRDGGVWDDHLSGRGGADLLRGNDGHDQLFGDGGNDRLLGGSGDDRLNGGDGDDLLRGGSGVDRFDGGAGNDRVSLYELGATQGAVVDLRTQTIVNDGFGNTETMTSIEGVGAGTVFADTFYGDDGANLILGGGGDIIHGFGGNDTFVFGDGPALLDGGDGIDTIEGFNRGRTVRAADGRLVEEETANGVHVDLSTERLVNDGWGGSGVIRNVENVTGTVAADTLVGDARNNVLSGLEGNDVLRGGDGDDVLLAGSGADTLDGGAGTDRLVIAPGAGETVRASLGAGSDVLELAAETSALASVVVSDFAPGAGGDVLALQPFLAARLVGWDGVASPFDTGHMRLVQEGAATLLQIDVDGGGDAFRTLVTFENANAMGFTAANLGYTPPAVSGGSGDDGFVYAPGGATVLDGGAGMDTLTITSPPGTAGTTSIIPSADGQALMFDFDGDGVGDLTVTGVEDVVLNGERLVLTGDLSSTGLSPNTVIFHGTNGANLLDASGLLSAHSVHGFGYGGDDRLIGGLGDDRLEGGAGRDVLHGREDDDVLLGGADGDHLDGGDGDDLLVGGSGDDVMTGGRGKDVFVFQPGFGNDRILDFNKGQDALVFTAMTEAGYTATLTREGRDTIITFNDEARSTITLVDVIVPQDWQLGAPVAPSIDWASVTPLESDWLVV